jgi:hypothetical protein
MNVSWFPQMPGVPFTASEGDIHRSTHTAIDSQIRNHRTLEEMHALEFIGVFAPNFLRRVHR